MNMICIYTALYKSVGNYSKYLLINIRSKFLSIIVFILKTCTVLINQLFLRIMNLYLFFFFAMELYQPSKCKIFCRDNHTHLSFLCPIRQGRCPSGLHRYRGGIFISLFIPNLNYLGYNRAL